MLTSLVVVAVILLFAVISWFLWKSGFLQQAEKPTPILDRPVSDARARKLFLARLSRWREEGKISREEYEHFSLLCEEEWD